MTTSSTSPLKIQESMQMNIWKEYKSQSRQTPPSKQGFIVYCVSQDWCTYECTETVSACTTHAQIQERRVTLLRGEWGHQGLFIYETQITKLCGKRWKIWMFWGFSWRHCREGNVHNHSIWKRFLLQVWEEWM